VVSFLDFSSYPLWANLAVFTVVAAVVWFAGTRVSGYANTISERTGIGKAFIGLILLGGVTSLPEVAVVATSSFRGDAALAINNLLGSVAMNVAILAMADAAYGRGALSAVIAQPVVLLQGTLDILLLFLVAAGIAVGEVGMMGVGAWSVSILALYLVSLWMIKNYQERGAWVPADVADARRTGREEPSQAEGGKEDEAEPLGRFGHLARAEEHRAKAHQELAQAYREVARAEGERAGEGEGKGEGKGKDKEEERSLKQVVLYTVLASLAILVAGYVLSRTGDAIAAQTGLGSSFVGAVLVAISTSLPEVSTVLSAIRIRQYELAFSDVFGTNLFDLLLVFLVDAIYSGPPVLNEVGTFSLFAALLGIAVTTMYLAGLIERKDRVILRMGVDSLAVIAAYVGGLVVLYTLR
jgi:cation:H+ antiporter